MLSHRENMLVSLSALLVMTPLRALESFVDGAPTIRQVTCNIYIYTNHPPSYG
jgi:hypothetical protein